MKHGRIDLVGAGPGDPDLLTVKAVRCLEQADVIVYDRLVSQEILDLAPAGATRISVGKAPSHHPVPQDEINELLIRLAHAGHRVVRLKGGDPFIFGRGSEEAQELVGRGIAFEVIPGITAAQGCAAALRVPLTHRGLATGVRYITGHCRSDQELDFDWNGLADRDTTLVVYMGCANAAEISDQLIAHGLPEDTGAVVVSNGTTPRQREFVSTLGNLAADLKAASLEGPVLILVGRVVELVHEIGRDEIGRIQIDTPETANAASV